MKEGRRNEECAAGTPTNLDEGQRQRAPSARCLSKPSGRKSTREINDDEVAEVDARWSPRSPLFARTHPSTLHTRSLICCRRRRHEVLDVRACVRDLSSSRVAFSVMSLQVERHEAWHRFAKPPFQTSLHLRENISHMMKSAPAGMQPKYKGVSSRVITRPSTGRSGRGRRAAPVGKHEWEEEFTASIPYPGILNPPFSRIMPHRTAPSVLFMEYFSKWEERKNTLCHDKCHSHKHSNCNIAHVEKGAVARWAKLQGGAVDCVKESLNKLTLWQVNCSGEVLGKG